MQDNQIRCFGVEPNRIILGRHVYDILESEYRYGRYSVIEHHKEDWIPYVFGLPITVDNQNKWLIQVCSGFQMDGKELLYPDKIDPEEV